MKERPRKMSERRKTTPEDRFRREVAKGWAAAGVNLPARQAIVTYDRAIREYLQAVAAFEGGMTMKEVIEGIRYGSFDVE